MNTATRLHVCKGGFESSRHAPRTKILLHEDPYHKIDLSVQQSTMLLFMDQHEENVPSTPMTIRSGQEGNAFNAGGRETIATAKALLILLKKDKWGTCLMSIHSVLGGYE
mmetsp:Transcript_121466/g.350691  ORF Transcript_121466/g.350691 Transcript_121466/m.350691 type:complete len:110 (+) Transcript_121466:354-683(+)